MILGGHAPAGLGTPLGRELLAARVTLEVALAYRDGAPPPDARPACAPHRELPEPVREMSPRSAARGVILEVVGGGLVPGRPLEQLSLADVRAAIAGEAPVARETPQKRCSRPS